MKFFLAELVFSIAGAVDFWMVVSEMLVQRHHELRAVVLLDNLPALRTPVNISHKLITHLTIDFQD